MSWITRISDGVSRCGDVRGQRLVVEYTLGVPPLPCVEPTRRQPEEPQEGPQRDAGAGLIDGPQDPQFVGTLGQSLACQPEARDAQQDESEPEQRREFLDALSEFEDLLAEFPLGQVRHSQTDHHGRRGAEPPPRRRPRNAEISGDGEIPGALDELAQPMVVALLRTGRGHGTDHRLLGHRRSTSRRRMGASTL
jgi:hypothetical protein